MFFYVTKAVTFPAHLAPQSVNLKVQEVNFDHFIFNFLLRSGRGEGGVLHGKRVMYAFKFFFSSWFCHTWDSVINSEIVLHDLSA